MLILAESFSCGSEIRWRISEGELISPRRAKVGRLACVRRRPDGSAIRISRTVDSKVSGSDPNRRSAAKIA